jgi:hypothetical protein
MRRNINNDCLLDAVLLHFILTKSHEKITKLRAEDKVDPTVGTVLEVLDTFLAGSSMVLQRWFKEQNIVWSSQEIEKMLHATGIYPKMLEGKVSGTVEALLSDGIGTHYVA